MESKPGHSSIKQKTRNIPYHLQNYFERKINKLIFSGHLKKCRTRLFLKPGSNDREDR